MNETKNFLDQRQAAYRQVFDTPVGRQVLEDLAKFCRAHKSTFSADARLHAALEGRREVWLRIQEHLNLSDQDLYRLYRGS